MAWSRRRRHFHRPRALRSGDRRALGRQGAVHARGPVRGAFSPASRAWASSSSAWPSSPTAPRSRPTRSSSARARAPRSSPPAASATCSRSAAATAPILYNIKAARPPPLVPRSRVFEVAERTLYDGTVRRAVDPAEVGRDRRRARRRGIEAVAICFLHAYANDANERASAEIVRAALPERRDLALLGGAARVPRVRALRLNDAQRLCRRRAWAAIWGRLQGGLGARGYARPVDIMTSNGGTWPIPRIVERPINSVLSGPAAGVIGAHFVGRAAGYRNLITYDMGGTSTDACLDSRRRLRHVDRRAHRRLSRSSCSRSRSTASARARARSPGSTPGGRSRSGRSRRVRCPGPPATAAAEASPR